MQRFESSVSSRRRGDGFSAGKPLEFSGDLDGDEEKLAGFGRQEAQAQAQAEAEAQPEQAKRERERERERVASVDLGSDGGY